MANQRKAINVVNKESKQKLGNFGQGPIDRDTGRRLWAEDFNEDGSRKKYKKKKLKNKKAVRSILSLPDKEVKEL